jgi:hypothetical protein
MRPSVSRLALLATAALAVVPATAGAATRHAAPATPRVTSVKPLQLRIGDRLTITGRGFLKGRHRNTVVFKRSGQRAIFARDARATRRKLVVRVPGKLLPFLRARNGQPLYTRFRIRVLSRRFSERYTTVKRSPRIGPAIQRVTAPTAPAGAPAPAPAAAAPAGTPTSTPVAAPAATPAPAPAAPAVAPLDTDRDGLADDVDTDDDNDLLLDDEEKAIGTNPLVADTDGDDLSDDFEYKSALDLNRPATPYPGKRPYPNPLDGSDADLDFDQDSLTMREEYRAWLHTGRPATLTYSDGTRYTGGKVPAAGPVDLDRNGLLSDDEKDVDNDGLSNFDEAHGRMQPSWWASVFPNETAYPGPSYSELNFVDRDTDGDGTPDGADDQDHDGFTNLEELSRPADWETTYVSVTHDGGTTPNPRARVQPFNPCKPIFSDSCHNHPPLGYYPDGEDWASPYTPETLPPA